MPEQPSETAVASSEDLEIRWARPEFWIRALAFTMLFIVLVSGTPALIGVLIGHLWAVEGKTLETITLIASAAVMPGFVITLRQKDIQNNRPHPYAFLMRLPKWDRFTVMVWLIPTSVAVAIVSEIIQQVLMLELDHTMISGVMAILLYTICINLYGQRFASPRSAGG